MGLLTGAWEAVGCRLAGKPTSAQVTLMKSISRSFLQALQLAWQIAENLLSSTILMAHIIFGGGVGGFVSHGTFRSFLGLMSFI